MSKPIIHCLFSHDFHANTYVVEGKEVCVVIDAGASVQDIKKVTQKPVYAILITHAHFDHIWYVEDYVREWGSLVYLSQNAVEKLDNPLTNLSHTFCEKELAVKVAEEQLVIIGNDKMNVGDIAIESVPTPGHSNCSLSFIIGESCFCGDLLFADGIGRTDFEDGNIVKLYKSMKLLLATNVREFYPGHGVMFDKEAYLDLFERKDRRK